jgi:hypothetical protein
MSAVVEALPNVQEADVEVSDRSTVGLSHK